ncbi:uncharacterized protein PGTG_06896, partial [Puccinia graminis f. sp. tritici CRL 75-36-700-3]
MLLKWHSIILSLYCFQLACVTAFIPPQLPGKCPTCKSDYVSMQIKDIGTCNAIFTCTHARQ